MSLPPEDCCGSHGLTEEQARLYELPQPAELLEGLALEVVVLSVYDCCAMSRVSDLELINADIR